MCTNLFIYLLENFNKHYLSTKDRWVEDKVGKRHLKTERTPFDGKERPNINTTLKFSTTGRVICEGDTPKLNSPY